MDNLLAIIERNRAEKLTAKILQFRKAKLQGKDGADGQQGVQGIQGYTGLEGAVGEKGEKGEAGKDGITTIITKEVKIQPDEPNDDIKEELEELRKAYERLNNNMVGGVHGFAGGTSEERVIELILEYSDVAIPYDKLIDDATPFIYIGEADTGTITSASLWRIKRIDSTNDPDVEIRWANGVSTFSLTWDNRATYTYI